MKKIFITFLILIINLGLFHISFAQVGNDVLSLSQCSEYSASSSHNQEKTCLQDCLYNINKTSNIQVSFHEEKPSKKSDIQDFFLWEGNTSFSPNFHNKLLFYKKKLSHIYYKWYVSLVGIVLNIN